MAAICLIAASSPREADWVQAAGNGSINWTTRVLRAQGAGPPSLRAPNATVARLGAERTAKQAALTTLLAVVGALQVDSANRAESLWDKDAALKANIAERIKSHRVVDTRYYADGGVDLTVELTLESGLAQALTASTSLRDLPSPTPDSKPGQATGVVINARGLKLQPALAPRLLDATGEVVYGASWLNLEGLQQRGVVTYMRGLEAALKDTRVADQPLILRASAVSGLSDLVLEGADAAKLAALRPVLAAGRVIIVTD